jgi:hypothetical protein
LSGGGRLSAAALALLSLAGGPGCRYLSARGRDLSDIVAPGVSSGGSLGMRLGLTRLVDVAIMAQKDERFLGWRERNPRWTESSYGIPFAPFSMPSIGDGQPAERHWYDLFTTSRRLTHYPNRQELEDRRYTLFVLSGGRGLRMIDMLDVEVGVGALFGGLEISLRPGQLADFLLGWFGLDIAADDGPLPVAPGEKGE